MSGKIDDATAQVLAIQKTQSVVLRNQFISQWKDKTLDIVKWHGRKYYRDLTTSDEEYSVALRALNEAINSYDPKKNASFETFANQVITRRLMNYFEKQKKVEQKLILYDKVTMDRLLDRQAGASEREKELSVLRREDLSEFTKILAGYGYTWKDVRKSKPKHQDSLQRLLAIALHIVHAGLGQRFLDEQPCSKELEKLIGLGIKRRFYKEYRPYLVSIIITFLHHLPVMKEYLLLFRKEGEKLDVSTRGSR